MSPSAEDPTNGNVGSGASSWLADYAARLEQAVDDSVRVGAATADRWGRRSLQDQEWSVDTVTADVIADWEELTPLLGRWLDLWLEAAQQTIKGARPREQ